jgi:murein DD-endopeptidase MepM/ murein hydrolase activator NlpD
MLFLAACNPNPSPGITPTFFATAATITQTPVALTATIIPSGTPTLKPVPTSTPTKAPVVCSPLEGLEINELSGIISGYKYAPPLPGRDDGHPAVDFAYYRRGDRTTMLGLPVKSAMTGRIASVVNDRNPYGNMVMIETRLGELDPKWKPLSMVPTAAPTPQPDPRLTCPNAPVVTPPLSGKRSLYLLYAHLLKTVEMKVGERVSCGQVIGAVGTSGNSVNPHLHFEIRAGPSEMTFSSLGHYDSSLSELERSNYCTWRVSGWFQPLDPMLLLTQIP